jgi:hypothetical protein
MYYDEVCILKKLISAKTDYVSPGKALRYTLLNPTEVENKPLGVIHPSVARVCLLVFERPQGI